MLTFIETPNFTKQIKSLIADDAYAEFQQELSADPEQGDLIRGVVEFVKFVGLKKIQEKVVVSVSFIIT